jgi:hypothetical protein
MPALAEILARGDKDWRADAPPVSEAELAAATGRIDLPLPDKLLKLYRLCDSGEGSLPWQPWYFLLWNVAFVADLRESEHYRKHYHRYLFFGSNGAGEYFGIDGEGRVFFMDAVAGEESITIYCGSFDEFVTHIGVLPIKEQKV